MFSYTFSAVYSLFIVIAVCIFSQIYNVQPTPYIDEIFHIPQAQNYCALQFTAWNDKITTPPGLYIFTFLFVKIFTIWGGFDCCTVYSLRMFNLFLSFLTFQLIFDILKRIHPVIVTRDMKYMLLFNTVNIVTFPILYFYSFFYYTDYLSTYLVLVAYNYYIRRRKIMAGFFASLAVTVRQTNVMWILFLAFASVYKILNDMTKRFNKFKRKDKSDEGNLDQLLTELKLLRYVKSAGYGEDFAFDLLRKCGGYFALLLLFSLLAFWNGGFAFGDKSAHVAVIHLPQFLYFLLFTGIFAFPYLLPGIVDFFKTIHTYYYGISVRGTVMILSVALFTMEHLYLISDNRHYMFYIWKRFLQKSIVQFGLIPFYIIILHAITFCTTHVEIYKRRAFIVATILILIPQKLLEFRYFMLPYILIRMHLIPKYWWQLGIEFLIHLLINYKTISLFLYSPFFWPDGSVQRFSW